MTKLYRPMPVPWNQLMAIVFEGNGDNESYKVFYGNAIQLLNEEARASRGAAQFTFKINPNSYQFDRLQRGQ